MNENDILAPQDGTYVVLPDQELGETDPTPVQVISVNELRQLLAGDAEEQEQVDAATGTDLQDWLGRDEIVGLLTDIKQQRVNVRFKIPGVHLHGKLVSQDKSDGQGIILIISLLLTLGLDHQLIQGPEILIRNTQGHVGDHMHALSDDLLSTRAPYRLAIIMPVGVSHTMNG